MRFFCFRCGLAGENPIWMKIKIWRPDKRAWTKEAVPMHKDCAQRKDGVCAV